MLKKASYPIDKIRVPVKRIKTLDPDKVLELAESILQNGQTTPIRLREPIRPKFPIAISTNVINFRARSLAAEWAR